VMLKRIVRTLTYALQSGFLFYSIKHYRSN
jgi:hypothetical protein